MKYVLFIQIHRKLLLKIIGQFEIIAHTNGLSFRSEIYVGYHNSDCYVNLYLAGNKLSDIKRAWANILKAIKIGRIRPNTIKDHWIARVIRNKYDNSYDLSVLLADYTFVPNSKEIAHNFLESYFSFEKYLEQLPDVGEYERYELLIQIRNKIPRGVIKYFREIASAKELEFRSNPYNKNGNFTNFFIVAESLQKIKELWQDILIIISDKESPVSFINDNWAVVLYGDYNEDDYVVLADTELPQNSPAIAHNFLDDSFTWYSYQSQLPEERMYRKYDMRLRIPKLRAKIMIFELKKIVHQYQLIFGIGRDDKQDEIDFYIIGYSYEKMKKVWQEILSTVNDGNSPLTFLRSKWIVILWRSNLKDNAILLASPSKSLDKKPVTHYLSNDDPFVR